MDAIERIGHVPLPPYIRRDDTAADDHRAYGRARAT
jgi:S-adenosylmethionine:tRNA-ribosyltransferase-isomerase (queuine synthetase)